MAARKNFIGIDIGGSFVKLLLVKKGKIGKKLKVETIKKSRPEFLKNLEISLEKFLEGVDKKEISGIGCGVAGILDFDRGIILKSPNLSILKNFKLKEWLARKTGLNAKIDNDARCFLRGEHVFGSGKGYKNLVGLALGTGVGGGVIIDGKIIIGKNSAAGEIGHMAICGGEDLEGLTVKHMRKMNFPIIAEAYKNQGKKAREALKEFEFNLGVGIANIINIIDPEAVIIGGGAAEAAKIYIPKIKKIAARFIISPRAAKNIKIIPGNLKENAGALGAIGLFYE